MTTRREIVSHASRGRPGFRPLPFRKARARGRRSPSSGASPTRARAPASSATTSSIFRADSRKRSSWPVMLFLHGNGERGDGKERTRLRAHSRPAVRGVVPEAKPAFRDHLAAAADVRPGRSATTSRTAPAPRYRSGSKTGSTRGPTPPACGCAEPMQGKLADDKLPDGPEGPPDGWNEIESELWRWSIARSRTSRATRSACI